MDCRHDQLWLDKALEILAMGRPCILVTVAETQGSSPRDIGANMLVHADGIEGTIGGGNLEFQATAHARSLLQGSGGAALRRFTLGPELGQCCGGQVRLLFERLSRESYGVLSRGREIAAAGHPCCLVTSIYADIARKALVETDSIDSEALPAPIRQLLAKQPDSPGAARLIELSDGRAYFIEWTTQPLHRLYLFGAGHVGKAVVSALAPLPFQITWIDGRDDIFPPDLAARVVRCVAASPPSEAKRAPAGTLFLVMTHSHQMDLEICAQVLQRPDVAFLGLIGSETKRARFAGRLRAIGVPPHTLSRLTCPIGIPGIASKTPAAIAIAVAAQLLMVVERRRQAEHAPLMTALGMGS